MVEEVRIVPLLRRALLEDVMIVLLNLETTFLSHHMLHRVAEVVILRGNFKTLNI